MAFTPYLSDVSISDISGNTAYRNSARENSWGSPVYFCPDTLPINTGGGYGGPRYESGYNYDNSPETTHGNCTWWCCGRLKDALGISIPAGLGNGEDWYGNFPGTNKGTDINDLKAGDVICFSGGDYGHVMFVEQIIGNNVYISQSAYSSRSLWEGYAAKTTVYTKSELAYDEDVDMYKGISLSPYYVKVMGYLHTGEDGPTPPPQTDILTIEITPSSYNKIMQAAENYLDFHFNIGISGIPAGETVSGGNSYPGLTRVQNSGWSYTDYQVNGITYRSAVKTQTLRYNRESGGAYTTVKHMYFNITKLTGTISTDTPMYITVRAKTILKILGSLGMKRRKRGLIRVRY